MANTPLPIAPGLKEEADARLSRIEGQVRLLRRMIEEDRYCVDVLQQIASVHEALRGVGKLMVQRYLGVLRDRPDQPVVVKGRVPEEATDWMRVEIVLRRPRPSGEPGGRAR